MGRGGTPIFSSGNMEKGVGQVRGDGYVMVWHASIDPHAPFTLGSLIAFVDVIKCVRSIIRDGR